MIQRFNKEEFLHVFSDARLVDIDLSQADRHIALWVFADHYEDWTSHSKRCPLVVVEFSTVHRFVMKFTHLGVTLDNREQHFQWGFDNFDIMETQETVVCRLWGSDGLDPRLEIECEAVNIRRAPNSLLDELFSRSHQLSSCLMRPGIEEMTHLFKKRGEHKRRTKETDK